MFSFACLTIASASSFWSAWQPRELPRGRSSDYAPCHVECQVLLVKRRLPRGRSFFLRPPTPKAASWIPGNCAICTWRLFDLWLRNDPKNLVASILCWTEDSVPSGRQAGIRLEPPNSWTENCHSKLVIFYPVPRCSTKSSEVAGSSIYVVGWMPMPIQCTSLLHLIVVSSFWSPSYCLSAICSPLGRTPDAFWPPPVVVIVPPLPLHPPTLPLPPAAPSQPIMCLLDFNNPLAFIHPWRNHSHYCLLPQLNIRFHAISVAPWLQLIPVVDPPILRPSLLLIISMRNLTQANIGTNTN